MMKPFDAPIPGESLTGSSKKYPWERPPEMNDPEEVTQFYLDKFSSNAETLDSTMTLFEHGVTIKDFVEGVMRLGVSKGYHSIDVGLLAGPVLHEFLKSSADYLGVDYDEGIEDKKGKEELAYAKRLLQAKKTLSKMGDMKPEDTAAEELKEGPNDNMSEEVQEGEVTTGGFMQRRGSM